ncbi:HNH endonuclease [Hymenobacter busanensis]|uniref:HNH endonuclease n=1 Tax=Hymenobacter busanensis TaxID=2607656 RepID=A0A7L4ZRU5_9BACT|nr:HNH endonuclease signature motif containing protein [Hymenobacter busanensis]KAA9327228.1 HNH endonuclease [Hymenobacter busanensis]QHJ05894.1 HNH endonuclease [Hymenobacter busanensis]
MKFSEAEYWNGIILYGLNAATYKIALGKTLLDLTQRNQQVVTWDALSQAYLDNYLSRLAAAQAMPQQSNPARLTIMERIVREYQLGKLTYAQAVEEVGLRAFHDVIPRFQTIGTDREIVQGKFYNADFGRSLNLTEALFRVADGEVANLQSQLDSRWGLLEGAFQISHDHSQLANDLRGIYLLNGYHRTNLTANIPFLEGYQANTCFYCGEPMAAGGVHVDHVLPRQVLHHDEIWNLVLAHQDCNLSKSDRLVGEHFIQKLIARNENIMGSNHPWKGKIERELGSSPAQRAKSLRKHYDNAKEILGAYYWGGAAGYNPEADSFYRKLITRLNNKKGAF